MTKSMNVPQFKLNERGLARFFGSLEALIMEQVWAQGKVSVQDVCDQMGQETNYKTVMTVMNRLADKGLLKRKRESRAFVYAASVERDQFISQVSQQVASGLVSEFGDAAVAGFIDVLDTLDPASLEKLEQLLKERKETPR